MSDDLLGRATSALRDTTVATPDQLDAALARLERARRPRASSRRRWYTGAWTVASCFVGVGAWANATGRVNWFEFSPSAEAPAPSAAETPAPPARSPAPVLPAPVLPAPEPAPEITPELPAAPPRRAPARREPSAPEVVPPPIAVPATPDPADTLYRAAHTAHFANADYAAALDAWDRYLDLAGPGHRFWLEARFNRAITLYRLGRFAAAREALIPFAGGEYGGYRRADAQRLLDAIDEQR
jgi:hypothetical protein